eukprot:5760271-Ditylum_brightwellii.AAC.1
MCPKKGDEEVEKDKKTRPTGHMHVTTDDILKYDKDDEDEDYGDWGLISLGGFMFHQHGEPSTRSYRDALLKSASKSRWTDAANHLL